MAIGQFGPRPLLNSDFLLVNLDLIKRFSLVNSDLFHKPCSISYRKEKYPLGINMKKKTEIS